MKFVRVFSCLCLLSVPFVACEVSVGDIDDDGMGGMGGEETGDGDGTGGTDATGGETGDGDGSGAMGGMMTGDGDGDSSCMDSDEDGVCDDDDNCPDDANPAQIDQDEDGEGDVCDSSACVTPVNLLAAGAIEVVDMGGTGEADGFGIGSSCMDGDAANILEGINAFCDGSDHPLISTRDDLQQLAVWTQTTTVDDPNAELGSEYGYLIVDLGEMTSFSELEVFQQIVPSDDSYGKSTAVRFSIHEESGDTPPEYGDADWEESPTGFQDLPEGATEDDGFTVTEPLRVDYDGAETRYLLIEVKNDGSLGGLEDYIEFRGVKMYGERCAVSCEDLEASGLQNGDGTYALYDFDDEDVVLEECSF